VKFKNGVFQDNSFHEKEEPGGFMEYILGSDNWFWFSLPNFSVLRVILDDETSRNF